VSVAVLNDKIDLSVLDRGDKNDQEQLLRWRVLAALVPSSEELLKRLGSVTRSNWVRHRFLYPFVYYNLNNASDKFFDSFLTYILSGAESYVEKTFIRLLLRDELCFDVPVAFRYFLALNLHPFDAVDLFLTEVENRHAQGLALSDAESGLFTYIGENIAYDRAENLWRNLKTPQIRYTEYAEVRALAPFLRTVEGAAEAFAALTDWRLDTFLPAAPGVLGALLRMRSRKYPEVKDFDVALAYVSKLRFCEAGRAASCLFGALYLIPRRDSLYERRDVTRLAGYLGNITSFLVSAPAGDALLVRRSAVVKDGVEKFIDTICARIGDPSHYKGRLWINAAQLSLGRSRRELQLESWMKKCRAYFTVQPSYITANDWGWLNDVMMLSIS
jgi:hypothetical protein